MLYDQLIEIARTVGKRTHMTAGDPECDLSAVTGEKIASAIRALSPPHGPTPPTKSGYYIARHVDETYGTLPVRVLKVNNKIIVLVPGVDRDLTPDQFTYWVGPLTMPILPAQRPPGWSRDDRPPLDV